MPSKKAQEFDFKVKENQNPFSLQIQQTLYFLNSLYYRIVFFWIYPRF